MEVYLDLFERSSLPFSEIFHNISPLASNEQENFLCPVEGAEAGFKSTEEKRNIAPSIIHIMPHTKHHVSSVVSQW